MSAPLPDRQFDHLWSDVETHDARARRCQRVRDVAGAGREIQSPAAAGGLRHRHETPLPAAIPSARERDRDEIVSIRDRREQRSHVPALALRRRNAIVQGHKGFDNQASR